MSPPRKSICRKVRYPTQDVAAHVMTKRALGARKGVYLRVYRCPYCKSWHLTHQRERSV